MRPFPTSKGLGIGIAVMASVVSMGTTRPAAAQNHFYPVPIGYTWDHLSYADNPGDWDVAIGDTGFEADAIPGNTGNPENGPPVTVINSDPLHGFSAIPILVGPTADGMNNVQVMNGQTIPVVPGNYKALYLSYSAVCGPHQKPVILNYADGQTAVSAKFADWCAASQAPPDFFTWTARHRNNRTGQDNNSCSLITKYIPVNPNRTLLGVTLGFDQSERLEGTSGNTFNGGGEGLPGDVISTNCGRTVLGGMTLVSSNPGLGGYGFVRGRVLNADGSVFEPDSHEFSPTLGAVVSVIRPYLGHYGAGVNTDGTYTIGLPPGTYTLSAAVRNGGDENMSAGLQANPVTVTIAAGQTVDQDIRLLDEPDADLWGTLEGVVNDPSGNPIANQFIALSATADGTFTAKGLPGRGLTRSDGVFTLTGVPAGEWYLVAGSNEFRSDPIRVTVAGGATTTVPDISVKPLPIGSISGTVRDPSGTFGGLGQTIQLVPKAGGGTSSTTTFPDPLPAGSAEILPTMVARFNFEAVPVGEYTLNLLPGSANAQTVSVPVTVTQGQTADAELVLTVPEFTEGTPNPTIVPDPFGGGVLSNQWIVANIFEEDDDPGGEGTAQGNGTLTTFGNQINQGGVGDQFTYHYTTLPTDTDFSATLDVLEVPDLAANSRVGLMLREDTTNPLAANFFVAVTNEEGIRLEGREAKDLLTFLFRQTAPETNPANADEPGTQPELPVSIKLRKIGSVVSGYYSTDGGQTERFIGSFTPSFSGDKLRLGIAVASGEAGAEASARVGNFRFASIEGGTTPGVTLGDLTGDNRVNVQDATLSLRIAVGSLTPSAAQTAAGDVNGDGRLNVQDTTLILRRAVGSITQFPIE